MSQYIYETHLHTKGVSKCAVTEPEDYIPVYKKAGYAGIFVTDHFFNGNSAIDKTLPWEEMVNQYCSGYERAKKAAENFDFDVFFGIEYNFDGDEYLLYGLDKTWLLEHPNVMTMTHEELFQAVNDADGLMIQAHPYRMREYIKQLNIHPECVHGVEVYNSGNRDEENAKAFLLAKEKGLSMTSGSDMHHVINIEKYIEDKSFKPGGVIFSERLTSMNDFIKKIKEKKNTVLM
mgnify:CR=1 FL=1